MYYYNSLLLLHVCRVTTRKTTEREFFFIISKMDIIHILSDQNYTVDRLSTGR